MNNNKKYRKIVIIENGMEEHMDNNEKYKKIASVLSEEEKEEFDELITMRSQRQLPRPTANALEVGACKSSN